MKVGVHIPQWGAAADRGGVLAVAVAAEESGFDSVWVADHVVMPRKTTSTYPYGRAGRADFDPDEGWLDALMTLGVVAGATGRVQLGTSVLVAALRHPLVLAKAVSTLDVLSVGRVILGLGAGWLREEMAAMGVPFATRMRRLRETVEVLRLLWRDGGGSYDGKEIGFPEVVCLPKPVQRGGPPIWIGGASEGAARRAVQFGDGWHTVGSTPERIAEGRRMLAAIAREHRRPLDTISFSTSAGLPRDVTAATERLVRLQDLGVQHAILNVPPGPSEDMASQVREIGDNVLPRLRDRAVIAQ